MKITRKDIIKIANAPVPIGMNSNNSPKSVLIAWYISMQITSKPAKSTLQHNRNWIDVYSRDTKRILADLIKDAYVDTGAVSELIRQFMINRGRAWRQHPSAISINEIGNDIGKLCNFFTEITLNDDTPFNIHNILSSITDTADERFTIYSTGTSQQLINNLAYHIHSEKAFLELTRTDRDKYFNLILAHGRTALIYIDFLNTSIPNKGTMTWMLWNIINAITNDEHVTKYVVSKYEHMQEAKAERERADTDSVPSKVKPEFYFDMGR